MNYKQVALFFIFLLFASKHIYSQGYFPNPPQFEKVDQAPDPHRSGADKEKLLDYSPTEPSDQGYIPSCVGHAIAHALTIRRAFVCGITDTTLINSMLFSASYIYNPIKISATCDSGAYFLPALNLLVNRGACLEVTFPNSKRFCDEESTNVQDGEAALYAIEGFDRIFTSDDSNGYKRERTIDYLNANSPIIVGFILPKGFPGRNNKPFSKDTGHAMVVLDYNDKTKTFTLLNSYGKNWQNGGYLEISYEQYEAYAQEAGILDLGLIMKKNECPFIKR